MLFTIYKKHFGGPEKRILAAAFVGAVQYYDCDLFENLLQQSHPKS